MSFSKNCPTQFGWASVYSKKNDFNDDKSSNNSNNNRRLLVTTMIQIILE